MPIITIPRLNDALKEIDKFQRDKKEGKLKPSNFASKRLEQKSSGIASKENVIVLSQDDEFNRKILERAKINVFLINEDLETRDYSKQRNSGLNEVLAELAAKNKIKIGINLEKIIKKDKREQAKSLARLAQNIILCKKAKAELILFSEDKVKDRRAILSLLLTLGLDTKRAEKAIQESF